MRIFATKTLVLLLAVVVSEVAVADIYKWVDDSGKVHFSDKKPAEGGSKFATDNIDSVDTPQLKTTKKPKKNEIQSSVSIEFNTKEYSLSQNQKDQYQELVNAMFKEYQNKLDWPLDTSLTIPINIVSTTGYDYTFHKGKTKRSYYFPGKNIVVIRADEKTSESSFRHALLHECAHAITRSRLKRIPSWLSEGLSGHMEMLSLVNDSVRFDLQSRYLKKLKKQIQNSEIGNIYSFFNSPPELLSEAKYNAEKIGNYYSMSWSLVRFMYDHKAGLPVLLEIFKQVEIKGASIDAYTIISDNYPTGISGFEGDWRRWIIGK